LNVRSSKTEVLHWKNLKPDSNIGRNRLAKPFLRTSGPWSRAPSRIWMTTLMGTSPDLSSSKLCLAEEHFDVKMDSEFRDGYKAMFRVLDADEDGKVTLAELEAYAREHWE
jgi:hypothetical protein